MKRLLFAIALTVATLSASAQYEPGKWSMQVKYGAGASMFTGMESLPLSTGKSDREPKFARAWGLEFEYQISNHLGLDFGFLRSWEGGGWKDFDVMDESGIQTQKIKDPKIKLDYYRFPILANFYVAKGLALKTGVHLGYLLNADLELKAEDKILDRDATLTTTIDMKPDCKRFDVGIPVGISYETRGHVVFDARFVYSLTRVNKESVEGEKDWRNASLIISFGYKFSL